MNALAQTKTSGIDRELVRRTVANGATNDELELYLYDCARRNVHPLDKLLHFTKRGNRYVPVTSIDLMRSRAADTGQLAGSDDAVFVEGASNGPPLSASVTVYRLTQGQRFAYTGTARWSEYNAGGQMWQKMPHTMLAKCAEALALRKAFPQELSGLYSREEMDQAEPEAPKQITDGKRANPHVNRAEDMVDVPAHDDPERIPSGNPNIKPLPKKNTREDFGKWQQELHALTDEAAILKWLKDPSTADRVQTYPSDWQDIARGLGKQHLAAVRMKPAPTNGSGFLAGLEANLAAITDPVELQDIWEEIVPRLDDLATPDAEEAWGIFSKHEKRLEP